MFVCIDRCRRARLVAGPILAFMIATGGNAGLAPQHAAGAAATADPCQPVATPMASPIASPASGSTPVAVLPDTDLAWLTMQAVLDRGNRDLATVARPHLEHEELRDFADRQLERAQADLAQLDEWQAAWYPESSISLAGALATIDAGKMELDLPAGSGALDAPGASASIARICMADAGADAIYLQGRIDLAHQYIDLAQVAAVYGQRPEVIAAARDVIEQEQAIIGQLVTWQDTWYGPNATPDAAP